MREGINKIQLESERFHGDFSHGKHLAFDNWKLEKLGEHLDHATDYQLDALVDNHNRVIYLSAKLICWLKLEVITAEESLQRAKNVILIKICNGYT